LALNGIHDGFGVTDRGVACDFLRWRYIGVALEGNESIPIPER